MDLVQREFLDNLWRWKCGVPEKDLNPKTKKLDYAELIHTEWSPRFEQLCRSRLLIGAFRYGKLKSAGKPDYDRVNDIRKRLALYEATGNTEFLVDVANAAMLEFEEGKHPLKHFAQTDDVIHTAVKGEL